jgi:hypothetical protein
MPEMGVVGQARVTAIKPCPPLEAGPGKIVTGTFRHSRAQVLELWVQGERAVIGVTAGHPFWSPDRQAWVPAGELRVGERLAAKDGSTPVVLRIEKYEQEEPVYNIEVEGDHCYRVGQQGLLVHNASAGPIPAPAGVTDCCPEIRNPSPTHFELFNTHPNKNGPGKGNFIEGDILSGGKLFFVIQNEPKTTPTTGCPGRWMFMQMIDHFGRSNIHSIQGSWYGSPGRSDNLDEVNRRTAGGAMTIVQAAWYTWTGMRANELGFTVATEYKPHVGTPGSYTEVYVLFN